MAIISKIRNHSTIVGGAIAISLILFIVGGDLLSPNSFLKGDSDVVGKIAGKK